MQNKHAAIDIVNEVLEACIMAFPVSSFIISLYKQYQERGSLSKKQLQGLHAKASAIKDLSPGKLATLEAMIKKMPTRFKPAEPTAKPAEEKDNTHAEMIAAILQRYPHHKRALFLKVKLEGNDPLTAADVADLKRFMQLLQR